MRKTHKDNNLEHDRKDDSRHERLGGHRKFDRYVLPSCSPVNPKTPRTRPGNETFSRRESQSKKEGIHLQTSFDQWRECQYSFRNKQGASRKTVSSCLTRNLTNPLSCKGRPKKKNAGGEAIGLVSEFLKLAHHRAHVKFDDVLCGVRWKACSQALRWSRGRKWLLMQEKKKLLSLTMSAKRLRGAVLFWPLDHADDNLCLRNRGTSDWATGTPSPRWCCALPHRWNAWVGVEEQQVVTMHTQSCVAKTVFESHQRVLPSTRFVPQYGGASTFVLVSP